MIRQPNAAEEAMKMEAEANKADAAERHCEEQGDEAIQRGNPEG